MTQRPSRVTDLDVALLRAIGREQSVVAAGRAVGVSHDVAVYRLRRLARAFGGPVVASARGGRRHGGTTLTELGDRVLHEGFDSVELIASRPVGASSRPNLLIGTYHEGTTPEVEVDDGLRLRVVFRAEEGTRVGLAVDPEAILVSRRRFPSSARNVLGGTVERVVRAAGASEASVVVRVGGSRLRAALTPEPIRELGLRPGARVVLYLKATAVRRVRALGSSRGRPRP